MNELPRVSSESEISVMPMSLTLRNNFVTGSSLRTLSTNLLSLGYQASLSSTGSSECKCPHVLMADNDPFQRFYYQTLFQKTADSSTLSITHRKDPRCEVLSSGEELLQRVSEINTCKCRISHPLLIIDYNMGEKKLNGVETAKELRKVGFCGQIVIRTSEESEDLYKAHKDLKSLIRDRQVEELLGKSTDHVKIKEIIEAHLRTILEVN